MSAQDYDPNWYEKLQRMEFAGLIRAEDDPLLAPWDHVVVRFEYPDPRNYRGADWSEVG